MGTPPPILKDISTILSSIGTLIGLGNAGSSSKTYVPEAPPVYRLPYSTASVKLSVGVVCPLFGLVIVGPLYLISPISVIPIINSHIACLKGVDPSWETSVPLFKSPLNSILVRLIEVSWLISGWELKSKFKYTGVL